ncbi:hypothetical protein INT08_03225 [Prosthecochloris sp. N3]|uniref:Uncharacterized protein n=1 Tax=Prosthecochloris ethylica TaxID=2743976 RepID=A0ABR9XQ80_9CHLB|nr:hypothetical protein [Prosthecochloris ethylica]MBF0585410.1 hypothetical protein [Prosthecochloris ethylica]MBF0636196.1 hypothetical protein [Prosthecochloris ethylica]NUK46640.1 hypothetical protein [Prosthecochloris ethylica]
MINNGGKFSGLPAGTFPLKEAQKQPTAKLVKAEKYLDVQLDSIFVGDADCLGFREFLLL